MGSLLDDTVLMWYIFWGLQSLVLQVWELYRLHNGQQQGHGNAFAYSARLICETLLFCFYLLVVYVWLKGVFHAMSARLTPLLQLE